MGSPKFSTVDSLQTSHQVHNPDANCIRNDLQGLNRYITLAALNFPYVRPVQPRAVGKYVLRPPAL